MLMYGISLIKIDDNKMFIRIIITTHHTLLQIDNTLWQYGVSMALKQINTATKLDFIQLTEYFWGTANMQITQLFISHQ